MKLIKKLFHKFRVLIMTVLGIGLPLFIYLGFIRQEPLFDAEYDILIGRESVNSIALDSLENPLLSAEEFPEVYAYVREMVKEITGSEAVQYRSLFKYDSIQIIDRPDVLNAFCTPGGYIYVYTGLMLYLDQPDHLAGVIGHEIAHAEKRHSAIRLQKEFGRKKIVDFVLFSGAGLGGYVQAKILSEMLTLNYSRDQEAQADELSVEYLSDTRFACDGVAGFFKKLVESGQQDALPEMLSDHPSSQNRVMSIEAKVASLQCECQPANREKWEKIKAALARKP